MVNLPPSAVVDCHDTACSGLCTCIYVCIHRYSHAHVHICMGAHAGTSTNTAVAATVTATTLKHQDLSPGTVALQPPHAYTEAITTTCRDRFCHWHSLHSTAEITRGHQPRRHSPMCHWHSLHSTAEITRGHQPRRHSPTWPLKLQQLGTTVVYCDSPPSYNNQVQARSHA